MTNPVDMLPEGEAGKITPKPEEKVVSDVKGKVSHIVQDGDRQANNPFDPNFRSYDGGKTTLVYGDLNVNNTAPLSQVDDSTTAFNTAVTLNVLANDTDLDGNALSISGTPTSENGTVTIEAGSYLTFTPTTGFSGVATVNYTVDDGHGGTALGAWRITVLPAAEVIPPTKPVVTLNGGASVTNSSGVWLSASSSDESGPIAKWSVNGVEITGNTCSGSYPLLTEGTNTFTVIAYDAAGNASEPTTVSIVRKTFINASDSVNLVSVNAGDPIHQTLNFGEPMTISGGSTFGGAKIGSDGTVSGIAGAAGSYSTSITLADVAGDTKQVTVHLVVTEPI